MSTHVSAVIGISEMHQNLLSSLPIYENLLCIFPGLRKKDFSVLLLISFLSFLLTGTTNGHASANSVPAGVSNSNYLFLDTLLDSTSVATYNGQTSFHIQKDSDRKNATLQFNFDDKTYTTAEILLKTGKSIDFSKNRGDAFIRFKIKGKIGGERCFIGVADNDINLNTRTEVKYYNTDYFDITEKWQEVICPLKGFTDEGEHLLARENVNEYDKIDWSKVSSVRFSTEKEMNYGRSTNRISTIFIDDLEIVTDPAIKQPQRRFTPWRYNPEVISGPADTNYDSSNTFFSWLDSRLAPKTSVYTYGYPTDFSVFNPVNESNAAVLATFQNDREWSGVTLYRNNSGAMDVTPWYKTGGIEFHVKGTYGGELFYIGLLDDESDGIDKKVQSRISSRTAVKVTKEWQRVFIPFSSFESIGRWWNSESHYEGVGTLDWSKISEIRFSIDLYANKPILKRPDEPVTLYFSNIRFIKKSDVVSNELFWESFSPSQADRLIEDFNAYDPSKISINIEPTSTMEISMAENAQDNSNAVRMDYKIGLWGSAAYSVPNDSQKCDWSGHNAVSFDFYSSEKGQTGMLMIIDSGSEVWSAHFMATGGWQVITVPFSRFRQFEWWQPDSAYLNGKMDLKGVRTFDWRPGITGRKGTVIIDNIKVINFSPDMAGNKKSIHINQTGYLPGFFKKFSVTDSNARTFILQNSSERVILTSPLLNGTFWASSGQYVKQGEFSGISQEGVYTLTIQETGETIDVSIKDTLSSIFRDAVRMFYYQRASIDLEEPFAGKFHHIKGHPDTAVMFHQTTNKTGTADVHGGWYDAGDYGKYVVNGGITCYRFLSLCELYPQIGGDTLQIPESGNGINDLLDEVRYELDWFKRMQDSDDGGVYFKVAPLKWDAFVMPDKSDLPRYIIGKTTASTLNFSAVMAMAGRIFKNIDKKYSKDCIKRAVAAWNWALQNPAVNQPAENGGSGAYSDNFFNDEFFWAASELFTTTGKQVYKKYIARFLNPSETITPVDWQNVGLCGYLTLVTHFDNNEVEAVKYGNIIIRNLADSISSSVENTPFGTPSSLFLWGSNDFVLNHAVVCCYAYKQTGKRKYLNTVVEIVNYILGHNATGYSFVTGYGTMSPLQPHHRIMSSDTIEEPYPGFLVGGPNSAREDEASCEPGVYYPFKQPARSYVDAVAAYASNEVCINWNAVLVFVLGFLQMNK
ncbi:MAG: glycoside hydrolase family 9 protein [Chitinispirillaceae bacterium]|nr:glycoside hydrolase family 9 protein [Chitinispirillaceae bacterium]